MKKKLLKFLLFLSILLIFSFIFYQFFGWEFATLRYQSHVKTLLNQNLRKTFEPGEKIVYTLRYMGLPAGKAIVRVEEIAEFNKRKVYVLSGRARTSDFLSFFFEVEGRIRSYMDVDKLYSLYFEEESQASGHRKNKKVLVFNQKDLFLEVEGERVRILPDTQDPLSTFYLLRLLDMKKLKTGFEINIKSRKRDRTLVVRFQGKKELKTPFGKLKTIKISLHLKPVKATSRHEISGFIWFTDNKKRIPILVELKTKAGPASLLLYDLDL
jgi:hypothetical protein